MSQGDLFDQTTPDKKLDLDTLQRWLWESANILRGSIDSSDFKNYIFGLLFLKRANDVFEEDVERIMAKEGCSREDAEDQAYFVIPTKARWAKLTKKTEGIGIALDQAFAAIETENSEALNLEGVMTATKFGDSERLSDKALGRLLSHFNEHSLRNADLESRDLLGDAYEYLIKQFADDAGKKGGEFYTPRGVVSLIVKLIKPQPGQTVYDPTCGSGGMLIESARYVSGLEGGLKGGVEDGHCNISLYGQEKNLSTWAIGKLSMILHGFSDAHIEKGDTLVQPKHLDDETSLMVFDRVVANPPFSMKQWWEPAEETARIAAEGDTKKKKVSISYSKSGVVVDQYGRFGKTVPPRGYADLAFLLHMIASLKEDGRAGVVLPHGTLFRGSSEAKIREQLLKADLIEGIVGLPSGLFYNTGIPASVWLINKSKPETLKNKLVIIDASQEYHQVKTMNELLDEHITKIVDAYEAGIDVERYMRVVQMSEVAENEYNLNISRYIDTSEPEPEVDLPAVRLKIAELESREREIDAKLAGFLKELGL
jgi:type I restriction enzyme M protein